MGCMGCIYLCRAPAKQGNPRCICCGTDFCGLVGGAPMDKDKKWEQRQVVDGPLSSFNKHVTEPFVPCFVCCCGCRLTVPRGLTDSYCKCCCCENLYFTNCPSLSAGLFQYLLNCWCCYC